MSQTAATDGAPQHHEASSGLQTLAGFLAGFAIFLSVFALAYRPVRMSIAAMLLALVATAIGGRYSKLAAFAVIAAFIGFVGGLIIQVLVQHPVF
jgi:hypothetical protein